MWQIFNIRFLIAVKIIGRRGTTLIGRERVRFQSTKAELCAVPRHLLQSATVRMGAVKAEALSCITVRT